MEHWVGNNHQDVAKLENNFECIPDLQTRVNLAAGVRHAVENTGIKKRIVFDIYHGLVIMIIDMVLLRVSKNNGIA